MDAMRGIDPTSSMFHTQAARNISQVGFGSVRSQKEVKQDDSDNNQVQDQVKLSHHSGVAKVDHADLAENAAMSGEMAELQDDLIQDDEEITRRLYRGREDEMEEMDEMSAAGRSSDLRTSQEVRRLSEMDDLTAAVRDILKDIPERSLEPARNIVANQIQGSRPSEALTQLKPVEGVHVVDFQAETSLGVLDIHDTHNQPIAQDPTEEMDPEHQQEVVGQQLDQMIANLPPERQAVVAEMRAAVVDWAASQGIDPVPVFAERLRDLAAGWDDEALGVASQTYAEASREVGAAAAAE
ncbi:MAG: hypothetical protein ACOX9B_13760 [Candidatus Xenobium sp.]|jgi:hypothetical protein